MQNIQSSKLFSGFSEQEIADFIAASRRINLPRKKMLFSHGSPVTHFYLIEQGIIQIYRTSPEGHVKTLDILKGGQSLGESEIMDACCGHRTNAAAVEDSVLLEFPVNWIKQTTKNNHKFALNLLSQISGHAHMAELEAEHQASMSAPQLVACFMQRLCILHDFSPRGFELPYSKTLIASRLGMELETFSRTLSKLKDHGIVVEGSHVSINDLGRIEQYVCGLCSISEDCPTHQDIERKMQAD